MNSEKIGRIGGSDWSKRRGPNVTGIYNSNYDENGGRSWRTWPKPWSVVTPDEFKTFETHAEAARWAFGQEPA